MDATKTMSNGNGQGPLAVVELRGLLEDLLGTQAAGRPSGEEKLNSRVWRLRFETGQGPRSLILKRLAPEIARRNALVATRWLPALGLGGNGPIFLGAAAEASGEQVWHAYADHGEWGLGIPDPDPQRVEAAVRTIARLHLRFADHALLGECRLWGGDLGMHFYTSNVRDALRAVASLEPPRVSLVPEDRALRERLLARLQGLLEDAPRRRLLFEEEGGPETLLHGDLWTKNVFVFEGPDGLEVRLIDWDHAAVGPASYDLSTFLYRFPAERRGPILEVYRRTLTEGVAERGWRLPDPEVLNVLCETAEISRISNRLIWPALALLDGERWGWKALREIEEWFEALEPVLPVGGGHP
jgi:hypothetical protein